MQFVFSLYSFEIGLYQKVEFYSETDILAAFRMTPQPGVPAVWIWLFSLTLSHFLILKNFFTLSLFHNLFIRFYT
jgi:hypothetical protein